VATDAAFTHIIQGPINTGLVDSFQITGLTLGVTYYYRVAADNTNCSGITAYSNVIHVTTANHGSITYNTANPGGAAYIFTVPAGVTSLTVNVAGASGGNLSNDYQFLGENQINGFGDWITANLAVSGGQQLQIGVGARGTDAVDGTSGGAAGGYGGINGDESGGNGGFGIELNPGGSNTLGGEGPGGGGASDIRTSGGTKLIVAFGGGGAGYFACELAGNQMAGGGVYYLSHPQGLYSDAAGAYGDLTELGGLQGGAGSGGASVTAVADGFSPLCQASVASGAGTFKGGKGGTIYTKCNGVCTASYGGGGGGGGYFGGSGGCAGGGGSGHSYTSGAGVSNVLVGGDVSGYDAGNNTSLDGWVSITW